MYEEDKVKFNWKGFLLKLIIVLLLLLLVLKLLPFGSRKEANGHTRAFNNNFTNIKNIGTDYFTKDKLPKDDEEAKVTLRQLINNKKIKTLKGADGKVCNEDASYIKSYKKNIGYELEVYLECNDEKETSYIYLGCFDECSINKTTTTTKTTTTKKSNNNNSNNPNNNSSKNNSSKSNSGSSKVTTVTTTKVKKYAVIFNENGGTKVTTQFVVAGKKAVNPGIITKEGYSFEGWYFNGEKYNFNTPVNENIILIAKWKVNDLIGINISNKTRRVETYNQTLYSIVTAESNKTTISNKLILNIPEKIENYNNIRIKSLSYIRNITNTNDINSYLASSYKYDENIMINNYKTENLGIVDNIELKKYTTGTIDTSINWNGLVKNTCLSPINNTCAYGIVYRVIWEYEV